MMLCYFIQVHLPPESETRRAFIAPESEFILDWHLVRFDDIFITNSVTACLYLCNHFHTHLPLQSPVLHLASVSPRTPWTGRRSRRCRRSSATRSPRWPCSCSSRGWSTSSSAAPPTSSPRTAGSGPSASAPCAP